MPHIGSRLADPRGARLLSDWIRTLPPGGEASADVAAGRELGRAARAFLDQLPPSPTPAQVSPVLDSVNGAVALLDRAGSVPGPLRTAAAAAARSHAAPVVRDVFQRLLPPEDRRPMLGTDADPRRVLGLRGDPVRGRDLFSGAGQCARCHVRDGVGQAFGPDLGGVGAKYTREALLDQILHPSKQIAPEFRTTLVVYRDDTERSGFVVRRTADGFVLRDEQRVEHVVAASEVRERRELALSAMPEGLLASLTAQEAADLLDYLHGGAAATAGEVRKGVE